VPKDKGKIRFVHIIALLGEQGFCSRSQFEASFHLQRRKLLAVPVRFGAME